ncbi:MAG TPA: LacI family DNA-binding transcriptional regulator [Flavisolibacter sp.]|nr:LacI family DNA-binding transcriptional regulator [Flavisolibacter sp.]
MNQVTIQGLAKELNLSISTVSKALKDSYEISAETKERVLQMAKMLHYRPNPYASSLRRKKSNTIAVVIPEVADSFFSQAIKGIEDIAQRKGYHVLIYLTYEACEKEQKILEDIQSGRVDGVLMSVASETYTTDHIEALNAAGLPLVFFDRTVQEITTAKVRTDDYESGYKATQHLLERDCKQIAFLSISSHLDISNNRLNGYKAALVDYGLSVDENRIVSCTNHAEDNYAILSQLMNSHHRPDGVLATVEKLITPFYLVCRNSHIRIPQDVKVIGFSNLATAQILQPSLTTITQPAFDMGKAAATILFKALEKRHYSWQNENVIIPSELMIRESTEVQQKSVV